MTGPEQSGSVGAEGGFSWPVALGVLIGLQAQIEEQDAEGLLTATIPREKAREAAVVAYEERAGVPLPPDYRNFLLHANGWPGAYFTLDLFGLAELTGSGAARRARELLEVYEDEEDLAESGLEAADLIPVAAGPGNDLVVIISNDRPGAGTVVWFDGGEFGRYRNFAAFFQNLTAAVEAYTNQQ